MRKNIGPTNEQLLELYRAASEFKKVQPWKWLYDTDIICVVSPKDKTTGYCSVMGKGGEHYALGVYIGDEGIFGFYNLLDNTDTIPYHQALHLNNCLMCSFEDREQLSNEDRKQIKALGLSFRGRNAWPQFRRFKPGYHPWYLNREECIFLTHALKQTLFVATNILAGQLKLNIEQGRTILRSSEEKNGKLEWYSKEIQLSVPIASYDPVEINDDILFQRIKKAGSMGNVCFQVDTCYMASPVQDNKDQRPYYPRVYILADQKSGQIVDFEMYQRVTDDANVTLNKFINICLDKGIPKEIQVRSEAMAAILDDFCKKTGIKLKYVKVLSVIDDLFEEMGHNY